VNEVPSMSPAGDAAVREWASIWVRAGEALSELKRRELREVDTRAALVQLADAFEYALRHARSTDTSGLVVQQQLFARLRR
jgi:hypothetical protein